MTGCWPDTSLDPSGKLLAVARGDEDMRTPICDMLGIELPLLAFSHCRDVVAAVTNAGGFGVLGASMHTPEQLEHELAWADDHVGGRPDGADPLVPESVAARAEGLDAPAL